MSWSESSVRETEICYSRELGTLQATRADRSSHDTCNGLIGRGLGAGACEAGVAVQRITWRDAYMSVDRPTPCCGVSLSLWCIPT